MNTFSWMIYLANVADSFDILFKIMTVITSSISCLFFIFYLVNTSDSISYSNSGYNHRYEFRKANHYRNMCGSFLKKFLIAFGIFSSLAVITPSKNTVILIAASEIGQKILTSDKVNDIVDPSLELLQTYIKKELKTLKDSDNKKQGD